MHLIDTQTILMISLTFFVALLYSSVGHGGASGLLFLMSLFAFTPREMAGTALILNVIVAGASFLAFMRAGHFSFSLTWPFIVTSIPASFAGGLVRVSNHVYFVLLALVLGAAAWRMAFVRRNESGPACNRPRHLAAALPTGAGIGFLSGIIGIGGGIFLSPIIIFMKWADTKSTSAAAACFVLVNSIAGLAARSAHGGVDADVAIQLLPAALLGGLIGSHFGANTLKAITLRRALALVMLIAAAGKL